MFLLQSYLTQLQNDTQHDTQHDTIRNLQRLSKLCSQTMKYSAAKMEGLFDSNGDIKNALPSIKEAE